VGHEINFCFVFLRLMCPMLPVSLGCPFLIGPSVFSNVYFILIDKTYDFVTVFLKLCQYKKKKQYRSSEPKIKRVVSNFWYNIDISYR